MPEDASVNDTALKEVLHKLEDSTINHTKLSTSINSVVIILQNNSRITPEDADRLLKICIKLDLQYAAYVLTIISAILKNEETLNKLPPESLTSSALFLINLIKKVTCHTTTNLRTLAMQTFLSYPVTTLIKLLEINNGADILDVFRGIENCVGGTEECAELCHMLKLIEILPSEHADKLVKLGLPVFVEQVIPMVMSYMALKTYKHTNNRVVYTEYLEKLTDRIVKVDYSIENWTSLPDNICYNKMYPTILKDLLIEKSEVWHRLWIVIIKLMKNEITTNIKDYGTPINPMLPVVEAAFKMDTEQRVRAFKCWTELINNLCNNVSENCIAKRLKLLITPLKLNNAKVEDIALAKFDTWWHLITKLDHKSERFFNDSVISFLYFLFGRNVASKSTSAVQLSDQIKKKSIEAFSEIVGHSSSDCQIEIPRLASKIISVKLLINFLTDWLYCLGIVVKICAKMNQPPVTKHLKCMWKSLLSLISDLPNNNIRRDLFSEIMNFPKKLLEEVDALNIIPNAALVTEEVKNMPAIVFNALILTLFEENEKIKGMLTSKTQYQPLLKISNAATSSQMDVYFKKFTTKDIIKMFQPIGKALLHDAINTDQCIVTKLPPNDLTLRLWCATMHWLIHTKKTQIEPENLWVLLEWPLKNINKFKDVQDAAMIWYEIYNQRYWCIKTMGINNEISKYVVPQVEDNYFIICVATAVLKQRILNDERPGVILTLIQNFTSKLKDIKEFDTVSLTEIVVDAIVLLLKKVTIQCDEERAITALKCAKNILNALITTVSTKEKTNSASDDLQNTLNKIIQAINLLLKTDLYVEVVNAEIINDLIVCLLILDKKSCMYKTINTALKTFMVITSNEALKTKLKNTLKNYTVDVNCGKKTENVTQMSKEFISPDPKKVEVKKKKQELNIVSKVVENGEEYEVIKSNWRFNPKKLTENQKEKFQRKREDIPALYQDLSQSQDEFRLASWKTDSVSTDSTSTNCKSISNDTSIIKQVATDVVPNIIDNILPDKNDVSDKEPVPDNQKTIEEQKKVYKVFKLAFPKSTNAPRLALKDRVFRNMKNLLEKSTPAKDNLDMNGDHIENIPVTPPNKIKNVTDVSSAPPLLVSERPSRIRRKPKKFDDSQLISLKKRRYSQNDMLADSQDSQDSISSQNSLVSETLETPDTSQTSKTQQTSQSSQTSQNLQTSQNSQNDIEKPNESNDTYNQNIVENVNEPIVPTVTQTTSTIEHDVNVELVRMDEPKVNLCEVAVILTPLETNKLDVVESVLNTEPQKPEDVIEIPDTTSEVNKVTDGAIVVTNLPRTPVSKQKSGKQQKTSVKKSRIEKELAIDTVEGHPLLKNSTEKRPTRKNGIEKFKPNKRRSLIDKLNKTKTETPKINKKTKEKKSSPNSSKKTVCETDEENSRKTIPAFDTDLCSDDVIESSQDSTITTISVCSVKRTPKRPIVAIERIDFRNSSQDLQELISIEQEKSGNVVDDSVLPQNKTVEDKTEANLTENMDTQPMESDISHEVIVINDDNSPITVTDIIGTETQEIAEADTQPNNTDYLMNLNTVDAANQPEPIVVIELDKSEDVPEETEVIPEVDIDVTQTPINVPDDKITDLSSPYKDDEQRQQDFLNNTLEISPIKIQSPDRDKRTPSPETSSDYVVIQLTSPVHINGEPFENHGSPEFFTDDKVSPNQRDLSPPRNKVSAANKSPSPLSLKKNKPQVRSGGRAAHMLGLCMTDNGNTNKNIEITEKEQAKTTSTPVRRNLHDVYSETEPIEEEGSVNFLKLKRKLPSVDSSPATPILKRKLADIADESTMSPASKRKRVSFHDPPVSTTISVHKYIEPCGSRSPQSSAHKRAERQNRHHTKLPKRLENAFNKLDTVLSKAVESFTQENSIPTTSDDTLNSLDVTPTMEIVKTSELNDTDPICPKLVHCKDPISVIATDLTSPCMKKSFIKQMKGKLTKVSDLAKMTEVEVCRLCIKAPKVKVARRALNKYAAKLSRNKKEECKKKKQKTSKKNDVENISVHCEPFIYESTEMQTENVLQCNMEVQTNIDTSIGTTQTYVPNISHADVQTDESGSKSTVDVSTCMNEREDDKFSENLDETSVRNIASQLPTDALIDIILQKESNSKVLHKILDLESGDASNKNKELSFLIDFLTQRCESRELILLCSRLLQNVHDKPGDSTC